jgi:hypothetical protein
MRAIILPILCLALLSFNQAAPKKKAKKIPVSGTVTGTYSYCGGARPSDEMLAQLATPKPMPGKRIYIKKGEVNSFDSKVLLVLTSDAKGNFHTKLAPGKYLIVDSTKKDMTYYNMLLKNYKVQTEHYEAIDTLCLKEWFMKPNAVFEVVDKEVKDVIVNFHKTCDDVLPCSRFRGPFRQ